MGNWDADRVGYFTPYLNTDKFGILQDGEKLCEVLGIDFNEVYKRTNTSYKPIKFIVDQKQMHMNGTVIINQHQSVERIEAFIKLGRPDPVGYADETGVVRLRSCKSSC